MLVFDFVALVFRVLGAVRLWIIIVEWMLAVVVRAVYDNDQSKLPEDAQRLIKAKAGAGDRSESEEHYVPAVCLSAIVVLVFALVARAFHMFGIRQGSGQTCADEAGEGEDSEFHRCLVNPNCWSFSGFGL